MHQTSDLGHLTSLSTLNKSSIFCLNSDNTSGVGSSDSSFHTEYAAISLTSQYIFEEHCSKSFIFGPAFHGTAAAVILVVALGG